MMNISEMQEVVRYTIENNKRLGLEKGYSISLNVIGESGIGKTDAIRQICKSLDVDFLEVDLSGREDVGDLLGLPTDMFEMCAEGGNPNDPHSCSWISKTLVPYYESKGYHFTGRSRMEYSIPKTMIIDGNKPIVFYADDYNRSTAAILQAMMTLMKDGKINNWELPKGSTVITSSNPDDGEYHVQAVDKAHATRSLDLKVEFNFDNWYNNYGLANVDERGINFLLNFKEELERKKFNDVSIRMWTMFFDQLSGIKDWEKSLPLIKNIMSEDQFGAYIPLFMQFVANRIDKIPSLDYIFNTEFEEMKKTLIEVCKDRLDVTSIIKDKLVGYCASIQKDDPDLVKKSERIKQLSQLTQVFPNDQLWSFMLSLSKNDALDINYYLECYERLRNLKK